jgi:hypothetical protein
MWVAGLLQELQRLTWPQLLYALLWEMHACISSSSTQAEGAAAAAAREQKVQQRIEPCSPHKLQMH